MTYSCELRANWRPLLAAFLGLGSGYSLTGPVTSAIAPSLIADNHWSNAEFAAIGGLGLISAAALPFAGRLTDLIGVRLTALIGQLALPLSYLVLSMFDGAIGTYVVIYVVQSVICVTTTSAVYTRLCVQYVKHARGAALAIAVSGTAAVAAVMAPLLNDYVEVHGWRDGYQAIAVFMTIVGVVVFWLIPLERRATGRQAAAPRPKRRMLDDWPAIFRTPVFWILAAAMLLCNLPQVVMLSQLKMVLLANGVSGQGAGAMFSALSIGMLVGRIITGLALDRFNPYRAAFVTLGLPSIGLFTLASSLDATLVIAIAVFFLGFAFGAEGDIVAFLVSRHFPVAVYSSVMGLLVAAMSVSASSGAALLGLTLAWTGGFDAFLTIAGCSILSGGCLLLLLGQRQKAAAEGLLGA